MIDSLRQKLFITLLEVEKTTDIQFLQSLPDTGKSVLCVECNTIVHHTTAVLPHMEACDN